MKPSSNSKPSLASEATEIQLEAPLRMSLERAIEYIDSDEYVGSDAEIAPPAQTHPKCYYAQASRKPQLYDMRIGPSSSRAR